MTCRGQRSFAGKHSRQTDGENMLKLKGKNARDIHS